MIKSFIQKQQKEEVLSSDNNNKNDDSPLSEAIQYDDLAKFMDDNDWKEYK